MKQTVLHRPVHTLVPEHREEPDYGKRPQAERKSLFIALGMHALDPGYGHVVNAIEDLGQAAHFNQGLLYAETRSSLDRAFKRVNGSMSDPRIAPDVGLLLIDPIEKRAKWYLRPRTSDLLHAHWHKRNNLFVGYSCTEKHNDRLLHDIQALGISVSLGGSIWYISSHYSPKEAFQILTDSLDVGDRLTIFDAAGRVKSWQTEPARVSVQLSRPEDDRPTRASIHKPASWQERALAEFL